MQTDWKKFWENEIAKKEQAIVVSKQHEDVKEYFRREVDRQGSLISIIGATFIRKEINISPTSYAISSRLLFSDRPGVDSRRVESILEFPCSVKDEAFELGKPYNILILSLIKQKDGFNQSGIIKLQPGQVITYYVPPTEFEKCWPEVSATLPIEHLVVGCDFIKKGE